MFVIRYRTPAGFVRESTEMHWQDRDITRYRLQAQGCIILNIEESEADQ